MTSPSDPTPSGRKKTSNEEPRPEEQNAELYQRIKQLITRTRRNPRSLEKTKYSTSIVTFIDVLGFKSLVEKYDARTVVQILDLFYQSGKNTDVSNKVRVHIFSDCIIRIYKIDRGKSEPDTYELSPLFKELSTIASIQFELACWYGIVLRGAITIGDVFSKPGVVFGPALIEAYLSESTTSIFPRVIVDPKLIQSLNHDEILLTRTNPSLRKTMSYLPEDSSLPGYAADRLMTESTLSDFFISDENNIIFLDYLNAKIKGADTGFITQHKNLVVGNFYNSETDSIRRKYSWLAHYHNFTISTDMNYHEIGIDNSNIDQFLITDPYVLSKTQPEIFERTAILRDRDRHLKWRLVSCAP